MTEVFTAEEAAILHPYVTNVDRPIFALKNLPEEVVAVLFAYYSRSRDSLRRNPLEADTRVPYRSGLSTEEGELASTP